jgi:hypothetical protein
MTEKGPYHVGYRNPPASNRFRAGKSGNPKGRPKRSKNLSTVLAQELNTKVYAIENGKRRKISKGRAVVTALVNKAANGDTRAIPLVLKEERANEERAARESSFALNEVTSEDHLVVANVVKRILAAMPAAPESPSPQAGTSIQGDGNADSSE